MNVHLFDTKDSISTINFLTTFKLVCDTNKLNERAAMWVLLRYEKEKLLNALNSRMCEQYWSALLAASVQNEINFHK